MRRALTIGAAALAFGLCGLHVALGATARVPVQARFTQPAGIIVGPALVLPSVSVAPITPPNASGVAVGATRVSSGGMGNARLTIQGQPGDVVTATVPQSFTVVRSGGQETLLVKTNTQAEYQLGSGDVVLGGAVLNAATMSVDVGGVLTLASGQNVVPGPYEGLLVVVVQYN